MTDKEAINISNTVYQKTVGTFPNLNRDVLCALSDEIERGIIAAGYRLPPGPEQDKVEAVAKTIYDDIYPEGWFMNDWEQLSANDPKCKEKFRNLARTICALFPAPELKVLSEDELLEFLNIPLDAKAYKYAKTQLAWARVGAVAQLADDRRAVKGEK